MTIATAPADSIPAHVPATLVHDFDLYNVPVEDGDYHGALKRLHEAGVPDIFWTPRNGGHWVAARGEDIDFIQRNHDPFSNDELTIPAGAFPVKLAPAQLEGVDPVHPVAEWPRRVPFHVGREGGEVGKHELDGR